VRWRYGNKGEEEQDRGEDWELLDMHSRDGGQAMESNSRFLQWSDGSWSLAVGDELFDVQVEPNELSLICAAHEDLYLQKCKVDSKMIVKPSLRSRK